MPNMEMSSMLLFDENKKDIGVPMDEVVKVEKSIKNHYNTKNLTYYTKRAIDLEEVELTECAQLFSTSYGKYSIQAPERAGAQVKLSANYYKREYCKPGYYITIAKDGDKVVGHAFYIRKNYDNYGTITWVLQLVVAIDYRKKGIASTILRSIWGFSDDFAWGLATANPCTVRTLESATFRKCTPSIIQKNIEAIKLIGDEINFVDKNGYFVTEDRSQVNTNFFVDNSEFDINATTCDKYLGKLESGNEWLAFTFQSQEIELDKYKKHFNEMVAFSENKLKEAYSRMPISNHSWAKGTANEVDFITKFCNAGTILDLGCGIGRHSLALAKLNYEICGVDFSERHINYANEQKSNLELDSTICEFKCADVRYYNDDKLYDNVICMYDVIGSFPDDEDNELILNTAYRCLKKGGIIILSVMNMELTDYIVPTERKADLCENPDILLHLKPSQVMQKTGDIFDPQYLAIDTKTNLIYRKEQFSDDNNLSAEYVIRDKRYTMQQITKLLEKYSFEVIDKRYVRAGHFDDALDALDSHAKEICIVARKR